jgi:hypothetical protein
MARGYKTIFLFLFFEIAICAKANSQIFLSFGGGYTRNYSVQNFHLNNSSQLKPCGGLYFYGRAKIKKIHSLSIWLGLELIQKNYEVYLYDMLSQKSKNMYLVLPITIQANAFQSGNFKILGEVGLDLGYWASRVIEGYIPNAFNASYVSANNGVISKINVSEYLITNDFLRDENRIELSSRLGLLAQYKYSQTISLAFNLSFRKGLSSTSNNETVTGGKFNRTVVLSVEVLLKI